MKFFILTCVAIIAGSSWLAHTSSALFVPNLLVMLAVFSGFSDKRRDILALALCAGAVMVDMLSVLPFGTALFSVCAVLLALSLLRSFIPHHTFFYAAVALCVAIVVYWAAVWIFVYGVHALGGSAFSAWSLSITLAGIAGEIASTLALITLLYPFRAWITS